MNNMKKDLISVIVPTYGRVNELKRALKSVEKQTYKNIEVIIIDDNTDDEISKQVRNIVKKDFPSYSYIKNSVNLGGAESRNVGIKEAKGKYLSFLDDDDEYCDNKIELQYNFFKQSKDKNLALVYCYGNVIYPNGKIEPEVTSFSGNCLVDQMKGNIAGTSFWMVKKSAIKDVGGFKKIHSHQDGVVLLNLLANGYTVDLVKESIVNYYFHAKGKGITDVNDDTINADEEYFKMCKSYFDKISLKEQKEVVLKYYNDRNWNLIITGRTSDAIIDLKYLFKNFLITKTLMICIYRIIFKNKIRKEEKKFDKEVLLGD